MVVCAALVSSLSRPWLQASERARTHANKLPRTMAWSGGARPADVRRATRLTGGPGRGGRLLLSDRCLLCLMLPVTKAFLVVLWETLEPDLLGYPTPSR